MARIDPKFMLRLPADLKERIMDSSVENKRSLNAEIVARLEASFAEPIETFTSEQEQAIRDVAGEVARDLVERLKKAGVQI